MVAVVDTSETLPDMRFLRAQLAALRYLPLDSTALRPSGGTGRRLLADLIRVPENHDPLHWLRTERGSLCAVLALSLCVEASEVLRRSLAVSKRVWGATAAMIGFVDEPNEVAYHSLYGRLRDALEPWTPYEVWDDETLTQHTGEKVLRETLTRMRAQADLLHPVEATLSTRNVSTTFLLADLLRLPDDIDPLQWLQAQRSVAAASLVLARLLRDVLPSPQLIMAGPHIQLSAGCQPTLRAGREFETVVRAVDCREAGWLIHLNCFRQKHVAPSKGSVS